MAIAVSASTSSQLSFGGSVMARIKSLKSPQNSTSRQSLRRLNNMNQLHMIQRTTISTPQGRNLQNSNGGVIRCGTGMSLIFVASEVGPWSKTGGLGDVLGGLPPAMAVSCAN